jgi:hypothetical protein
VEGLGGKETGGFEEGGGEEMLELYGSYGFLDVLEEYEIDRYSAC